MKNYLGNEITHLVVNHIEIYKKEITIGATDNERWRCDTEEGMSGADAKTIVSVTLIDHGKGIAVEETAYFSSSPGDPTRTIAMKYLIELFDIAWKIHDKKLKNKKARKKYFGLEIGL